MSILLCMVCLQCFLPCTKLISLTKFCKTLLRLRCGLFLTLDCFYWLWVTCKCKNLQKGNWWCSDKKKEKNICVCYFLVTFLWYNNRPKHILVFLMQILISSFPVHYVYYQCWTRGCIYIKMICVLLKYHFFKELKRYCRLIIVQFLTHT